jgi:hypothetical protein
MEYLLLICVDQTVQLTPQQSAAIPAATDTWVTEMDARRVRREGSPLRPVREAATVRIRDGAVLVSDGPFAETKEQIAGYDVIDCSSLDEAIEVAAKHPVAAFGVVEVRPFGPVGWWRSPDGPEPGEGPQYLMIHRIDAAAELSPADDCAVPGTPAARALRAWDDETYASGVKLAGGRLEQPGTARTVRVRQGEVLVSDGPFAETKEQVAGLNILTCPTLAQAVEIASRHPTARTGTVELRPFAQG